MKHLKVFGINEDTKGNDLFKKYVVCMSNCYIDLMEIVDISYEGTNGDDMEIYLSIRNLYTYYDGIKTSHPKTSPLIVYTLNRIKRYLIFESDSYDECLEYINIRSEMEKYNL